MFELLHSNEKKFWPGCKLQIAHGRISAHKQYQIPAWLNISELDSTTISTEDLPLMKLFSYIDATMSSKSNEQASVAPSPYEI